jgi:hypothetical protein
MELTQSIRRDPTLRRPVVVLGSLFATVLIGEYLLMEFVIGVSDDVTTLPAWLPQFSMVGKTVVYYALFFDFLKFIAIPLTLVWLGYAFGRYRTANSNSRN